jgi:heterotetrameric sarcosine oxidase gamma subunit
VGLQDVSPIGKLDVKGTAVDARLTDCERLDGVGAVLRIKPGHALVLTERRDDQVSAAVRSLFAQSQGCAHLTDVTSALAAFMLVGPCAPDVLASVTSIDLRPHRFGDGSAAPCAVAHVQGVLYRRDWGELRAYLVLVGRDAAEYVWTTIHHAGEHFELIPFGVAAQRIIWESQAAVSLRASVSVTAG